MPKEVTDLKKFLNYTRRKDAKAIKIKKNSGVTKFKLRCSKNLYTFKISDSEKADKITQSLPSALPRKDI